MKKFRLSKLAKTAFTLLIIIFSIPAFAGEGKDHPNVAMAGIYTVNPAQALSATNFVRIGQADTAMMTNGISAPVTIQIYNGIYNQVNLKLGAVAGSSPSNTITFTSFSNDSLQVQIQSAFIFEGCSNIIIKKLNITQLQVDGTVSNYVVSNNQIQTFTWLAGNDMLFSNNYVKAQGTLNFASKTGSLISNIYVQNNYFQGMNYVVSAGIGVTGTTPYIGWSRVIRPNLKNNTFNKITMGNVGYALIGCCTYSPYPSGATFQFDRCSDSAIIEQNKFENISTDRLVHDIDLSNQNNPGPRLAHIVIRNNFFKITGQLAMTPYAGGTAQVQFYYNSVNNVSTGAGLLLDANVTSMQNNILSSTNGQKVLSYTSHPGNSDYNDLYTSGPVLVAKTSTTAANYATLAQYQSGSGTNANAKNSDPKYYNDSNLHARHPALVAAGIPFPTASPLLFDIDNDNRNALNPCIGADEYQVPSADVIAVQYLSAKKDFTAATPLPLKLRILNNGASVLNQLNIRWTINGVEQTPYAWTGNLAYDSTTDITFGTYLFPQVKYTNLKIWTDLPNAVPDMVPVNDTLRIDSIMPFAKGEFSLGGTLPDFPSFVKAAEILTYGGVDGPVNINVRSGKYTEQPILKFIRGAGSSNPVTFKGELNIAALDTLSFNSTGAGLNKFTTLRLDSAAYVNFKNITFQSISTYSREVEFINHARFIGFDSCVFTSAFVNPTYPHVEYDNSTGITPIDSNVVFTNNKFINGGNYGINLPVKNAIITGNRFEGLNASGSGMAVQLTGSFTGTNTVVIDSNYMSSPQVCTFLFSGVCYQYGYNNTGGIYVASSGLGGNDIRVSRNRIYAINRTGIYITTNGTATQPVKIYNNFVSMRGGSQNLVSLGTYHDIAYNNFSDSANSGAEMVQLNSNNTTFRNNLLVKGVPGSPINTSYNLLRLSTGMVSTLTSTNNAYAVPDSTKTVYNGSASLTLSQWKATGKDANSVKTISSYVNAMTDLHIDKNKAGAVDIAKKGIPLANILLDIDDSTRSLTTPCIGADEFTLNAVDAGALAITAPSFPMPAGNNAVKVSIKNYGSAPITSADVNWSVNNVIQPPYNFSGNIASGDSAVNLAIGTFNFSSPIKYTIKVWTGNVNGGADTNPVNDTASRAVYPALCGSYTVAGATPQFANLNAALTYANLAGISCPSIFNIRDGQYNEMDTINAIAGSSAINTLTIQSESLDSSKVSIYQTDYLNNGSTTYAFFINDAKYITLKNLTIQRTAPGTNHFYFNVISVSGIPTGLTIKNCEISTTGAGSLLNLNASNGPVPTDIDISNNNFVSGNNALNINGYFNIPMKNVNIRNNNFRKQLASTNSTNNSQLSMSYVSNASVDNNFFDSSYTGTGWLNGIYLFNANGKISVSGNRVIKRKSSHGIWLSGVAGLNYVDSAVVVANNFVTLDSTANNYAMYLDNVGRNVKVAYNNLLNNSSGTSSYALYATHSFNTGIYRDTIVNNNIININNGYALFQRQISNNDVTATNNNIWSSSSSRIATYNFTNYNTTAALTTASGTYTSAASVNPLYVSNNNLHVGELTLRLLGKPLSYVLNDIDNDVRGTTNSTIGADEIVINPNDAGITALISPAVPFAAGNQNVAVTVKNYGSNTLTSAQINWSVNGVMQTPYNYTGSIAFNTTANLVIGNTNFIADSAYSIKAWTSLPNGAADAATQNDTILVNNIYVALNGAYTLGGSSPDFKGLSRSATNLKYGGVLGNVTFNIRDGLYNETMIVDSIPFQNNFNITWQSESGDSSKVTMNYAPVLNDNVLAVLQLNNTKNINIKKIGIRVKVPSTGSSATYASMVLFSKKTKNILLQSNLFVDSSYYASGNTYGSRMIYNTDAAGSSQTLNARSSDSAVTIDRNMFRQVNLSTANVIDMGGTSQTDFGGNVTVFTYLNNLLFSNNRFDLKLLNKTAVNVVYADSLRLTGNKMQGLVNVYGKDLLLIDKNEVYHEGNGQNVVTVNAIVNRVAGKPVIISNNLIQSVRSGFFNGVPVGNNALYIVGDRASIIHNTIATSDTGNVTGYGNGAAIAFNTSKTDTVKNNILYNVNGGYLVYNPGVTGFISNNNDYVYTNHFSQNANTLAQYRTANGQDAQSVENINPYFRGPADLHASNILLKAAPIPVPTNPYNLNDVDGQSRGALSCYGADEFLQPQNDMIVLDASPKKIFPEGLNNISIHVYNNGSNPITSFDASASITNFPNNYTPTPAGSLTYSWSGLIAPGAEATITLGQMNVPIKRNIFKVNTFNLNGTTDEVRFTDSLQNDNYYCGLNGSYTMRDDNYLNPAVANFPNFSDATTQLKLGGVYGPSTLNILPGLWNAFFYADSIPNRGALSPLTIQSLNGDSSTTGFNTNNFTGMTIYKANNVTIKNLYFGQPAPDQNCGLILGYNSQNITVQNNRFKRLGFTGTGSTTNIAIVVGGNWSGQTGFTDSNYTIRNNYIEGGYQGINIFGNPSKPSNNCVIRKNIFLNQGTNGINTFGLNNPVVDSNSVSTNYTDANYIGLLAESNVGKMQYLRNRIYIQNDGFGIKTLESYGSPFALTDTLLIANNFITTGATQASIGMNIFVSHKKQTSIYHNSILGRSTSASSIGLKTSALNNFGGRFELLNNIVFNKTAGIALTVNKDANVTYVQHNEDLYTAGSVLGQVNGSNYANLPALTATGVAYSSVSGDPLFVSDIDLHADGALVNNTGSYDAYTMVTTDIDNESRSNATPDIGADEFKLPNFGAVQFETPLSSCSHTATETVKAWIKNFGTAARTNVPVAYRINNGAPVRDTVRVSINPGDSVLFAFTQTANLAAPQNYYFDVWTSYRGDSLPANDTLRQFLVATTPSNNVLPYYTGFEGTNAGWYTAGQNTSFKWGVVYSGIIDSAANGLNAWKTNLTGPHNNSEFSYLYSPCFDLSSITTDPTMNFNLAFQLENNTDKAWVEWSGNGGATWSKLGAQGEGLAWYNNAGNYFTGLNKMWHNAKHTLPVSGLSDRSAVRIRFVLQTNGTVVQDGLAIDDISLYTDANPPVSQGIYVNRTAVSTGSGTFVAVNDPSGNRLVEINDNGQNLGTITVDVNQNNGGAPTTYNGQSYLGRNWVIHVQNAPTAPVRVRLFFTQAEVDAWRALDPTIDLMRNIAVYKFSGNVEDFSLANNTTGTPLTLAPAQLVKLPYLDGYIMEFSVSSFSEFWLTRIAGTGVVPVQFTDIKAVLHGKNDALVTWKVQNEINVSHYDVEHSLDGNHFSFAGRVDHANSGGNYSFVHSNIEAGKHFYRIRQFDLDGHSRLSNIATLVKKAAVDIQIHPTVFNASFKVENNSNSNAILNLYASDGKLVLTANLVKGSNNINTGNLAGGSYLYSVQSEGVTVLSGKLIKQ